MQLNFYQAINVFVGMDIGEINKIFVYLLLNVVMDNSTVSILKNVYVKKISHKFMGSV